MTGLYWPCGVDIMSHVHNHLLHMLASSSRPEYGVYLGRPHWLFDCLPKCEPHQINDHILDFMNAPFVRFVYKSLGFV